MKSANLSPLEERLLEYRSNASSLEAAAYAVAQRQSALQTLYQDILSSINVTFRSEVEGTNATILILENDFTTTYILALSAQSLMEVTLNEFTMATNVLNDVERVRIPYLMVEVARVNGWAMSANLTARELEALSRNFSSEITELDNLIARLSAESAVLLAEANNLDWLQQEVLTVMEDIRVQLPTTGMDAREINFNLTRIETAIANLEQRFGSKQGSIPDSPDLNRLRNSIRQSNESRVYAMDELEAEIRRQQRNFTAINESLTSHARRFLAIHTTLHQVENVVLGFWQRISSAYERAQNIVAEGNTLINTATMVADSLENFANLTDTVQERLDNALAKVGNTSQRSKEVLDRVSDRVAQEREAMRNVSMAANATQRAGQLANESLEVSCNPLELVESLYPSLELVESLYPSLELVESLYPSLELVESLYPSLELVESLYPSLELVESLYPSLELVESLYPSLELVESLYPSLELVESLYPRLELVESLSPSLELVESFTLV